jgi:hypothetical protein
LSILQRSLAIMIAVIAIGTTSRAEEPVFKVDPEADIELIMQVAYNYGWCFHPAAPTPSRDFR